MLVVDPIAAVRPQTPVSSRGQTLRGPVSCLVSGKIRDIWGFLKEITGLQF